MISPLSSELYQSFFMSGELNLFHSKRIRWVITRNHSLNAINVKQCSAYRWVMNNALSTKFRRVMVLECDHWPRRLKACSTACRQYFLKTPVGRPESVNTGYGQPNIITSKPLSSPAAWSQCQISATTEFNRKGKANTNGFIPRHFL
jgi:hypothetical protein